MRRDFLKGLGIEDKDIIDKILDENSADIGRAKGELDTAKNRVTELEGQLAEKDKAITSLQTKADSVDGLNTKISELTADKTRLEGELNTKVSELQKSHAIESGVRDAKAKNVKAVMALLDMDKISYADGVLTGLDDQLATLQKNEDSGFLFGGSNAPAGTNPSNPDTSHGAPQTAKTFAEAVANALKSK